MLEPHEEWFETVVAGEKVLRHMSKFLRSDFVVSREFLEAQWHAWNPEEKLKFSGAFSARAELKDEDQRVLDFLMDNGDSEIWCTIALSVARHRDRNRAIEFLLRRVNEDQGPHANYYQALAMLRSLESVPILQVALLQHRRQVELHPSLETWGDRFFYLDYLSCSATLFKITGMQEYRSNIEAMLEHPDQAIRKMVRMIASSTDITL
jgi:hypothetical protein